VTGSVEVGCWGWPEQTGISPPPLAQPVTDDAARQLLGNFRPLLGPLDPPPRAVSADPHLLAEASRGLPPGPAHAEAVAARLRRRGDALVWGPAEPIGSLAELEEVNAARGVSSVDMLRADPDIVAWMQVGSWWNCGWKVRALRRMPPAAATGPARRGAIWRLRADLAFWSGVRRAATPREWAWLTGSYVVFSYHRLAGEGRRDQDQIDISPRRFGAQLRMLRLLGYRPLTIEELLRFHTEPGTRLGRRRYLVTSDDGFQDNKGPLEHHRVSEPVLFVPTAAAGTAATWAAGEQVLRWDELASMHSVGVTIGSHGRRHASLPLLDRERLADELSGSRADLMAHFPGPADAIAYPHGHHDARTLRAVAEAGYRVGFTTSPGRNGAGTHLLCLRRVGIWRRDRLPLFLWKAFTGEYAPGQSRTEGAGWVTAVRRARRRDRPPRHDAAA